MTLTHSRQDLQTNLRKILDLLTKKKSGSKKNILDPDFRLVLDKKMALTILFRLSAMTDKRHSSVTAGMPRFLALERQCSRFRTENDPSAQILRRRIMRQ